MRESISPTTRRHYQSGQALLVATVFFTMGSLVILGGIAAPVLRELVILRDTDAAKRSLLYAEGGVEDVVYRLTEGMDVDDAEVLSYSAGTAETTVTTTVEGKDVLAKGDHAEAIRKMRTSLEEGIGASFNYGMQADTGGIIFENSSSVAGNVYSNGSLIGAGTNLIEGNAVSAGPSGFLSGVHATGSAYSNRIDDATIDKHAYYQTLTDTTVLGTKYPGSADQPLAAMPITDETIALWEAAAQAGDDVITEPCPYVIQDDATLGPVKIECDLEIRQTPTVTLGGAVWVTGNITFTNSPLVRLDPSLGVKSVPMIAHDPDDTLTSSKIIIHNSMEFGGSGSPNSYVMLVSQNSSASAGGAAKAIQVRNSATGNVLVYAAHGEIQLENNVNLKEVTAFRIRLQNSARVIYETGISSLLFDSGPGGGYTIGEWKEVP